MTCLTVMTERATESLILGPVLFFSSSQGVHVSRVSLYKGQPFFFVAEG